MGTNVLLASQERRRRAQASWRRPPPENPNAIVSPAPFFSGTLLLPHRSSLYQAPSLHPLIRNLVQVIRADSRNPLANPIRPSGRIRRLHKIDPRFPPPLWGRASGGGIREGGHEFRPLLCSPGCGGGRWLPDTFLGYQRSHLSGEIVFAGVIESCFIRVGEGDARRAHARRVISGERGDKRELCGYEVRGYHR